MPISPMVQLILEQLQAILRQEQAEAYFVGGCVRDLLLGRPLHDLDLAAPGDAVGLARRVARAFHAAFVLLDEENGVARVVLRGQEDELGTTIDFARMRGNKLAVDLVARDLTINAMAMAPTAFSHLALGETASAEVVDPCGGQDDLRAGRLRAVSADVLHDDPLRTMRAVRLSAELDFSIEPQTAAWIRQAAGLLPSVSWERIRDELARTLACDHAAPYLSLLDSLGLLPYVLADLEEARAAPGLDHLWETVCCLEWIAAGLEDGELPQQAGPFWQPAARQEHPGLALRLPYGQHLQRYLGEHLSAERSRLVLLKLAALLHHVGRSPEEGARLARQVAQRTRLSAREALSLATAVALRSGPAGATPEEASRREVYRFYRDAGEIATGALFLSLADDLATSGPALDQDWWDHRVSRTIWILTLRYEQQGEVISPPRLVDGSELIDALSLAPGPLIGELLEGIREAQAAGEVHTREEALAWAKAVSLRETPVPRTP